jgi:hypothetical protein
MSEPSLGQVRDEMLSQFNLDARVRGVEIKQAATETALGGLRDEVRLMRTDVLAAIESNKPKPIWPALSAMAAAMSVLMVLFGVIYGTR